MDPEELARQQEEAAAAAAEARLATMTDPPADPPPEPQDPPADPPEPQDPPAGDPPADPPEPQDPPAPAPPRGSRTLEARIGTLVRDKRSLAERLAVAEAENARLRATAPSGGAPPSDPPSPTGDPPAPAPQRNEFRTQAEFDLAVQTEAQRRADLAEWNRKCNDVEDLGSKLGDRWQAAKRNLALLDDNGVIPFALLSVALETDAPDKVILTLGEDPDRAADLLAMTPVKRALEIAKMAGPAAPAPKPRSAAPPPVDPLRGRGAPAATTNPTDRDTDAEWLRKRNADIDAKRIAEATRQRAMG